MSDEEDEDAAPRTGRRSLRRIRKDLAEEDIVNNLPAIKLLLEDLEETSTELHRRRAGDDHASRREKRVAVLLSAIQTAGGVLIGVAATPVIAGPAWFLVAALGVALSFAPPFVQFRGLD